MAEAGTPTRGFATSEYEARVALAQARMADGGLDGIVLSNQYNFRYFSGFASQFWESPTRPFFLVLPAEGPPIGVVPEIGAPGLAKGWVTDIRTWPAPQPEDDGVTLLTQVLAELPHRHGRVGWEMGRESVLRMPIIDFDRLRGANHGFEFADASPMLWGLRMVKSPAEIAKVREACRVGSDAFDLYRDRARLGSSEVEVARQFRICLLEAGADATPFVAVASGPGGPDQIIAGPGDRHMAAGDILFIDTGATFDGYFCDFDRTFAFGHLDAAAAAAHRIVWAATEAGIQAARPGITSGGLWRAMAKVLEEAGAPTDSNVGRSGHGLGMQLTEPPSNMPGDETVLKPGMVMTVEPGMEYAPGKLLVHEENLVITEEGAELLTRRTAEEMPVIER